MENKRLLTKEERELNNKGAIKREQEIKECNEALKIHNATIEFTKAQREYEDILRPYNRKVEDKNIITKLKTYKTKLQFAIDDLKNLKQQLKYGVTVKETLSIS